MKASLSSLYRFLCLLKLSFSKYVCKIECTCRARFGNQLACIKFGPKNGAYFQTENAVELEPVMLQNWK